MAAGCAAVYVLVVVFSVLVGNRHASGHGSSALASSTQAADPGAPATVAMRGAGLAGGSLRAHVTPNPRVVRPHDSGQEVVAVRGAADTGSHQPATASIASISPARHSSRKPESRHESVPKTTHPAKPKPKTESPAAGATVLAEADAGKGTRVTSLEAMIPDPTLATITISATRGPAFVEVRLKTRTGPLLSKGIVPQGETITFSNKQLWVELHAPGRLDLSVNGKPWRPTGGTVEATLSPTGVQP